MAQNLVINGVIYNGVDSLTIPKSDGGNAEYVDATAVSSNSKSYEITLAKASGWVLLTTLDADVLAHINDASLVVSLVRTGEYVYENYSTNMAVAANTPRGYTNSYPVYGMAQRQTGASSSTTDRIYYPANKTDTSTSIGGLAYFRINGSNYYIRASDGYVQSGTYYLTFMW